MSARARLLSREASRLALLAGGGVLALLAPTGAPGWRYLVAAVAPVMLLAPLAGWLPRRAPLLAGLAGLLVAGVALRGPGVAVLGAVAAWYALFTPAHVAARVADAGAAGWPLTIVNGVAAAAGAAAVSLLAGLPGDLLTPEALTRGGPFATGLIVALVLGLCAAVPASDPVTPRVGFVRATRLVLADREARALLLGSALFHGWVLAAVAAVLLPLPGERLRLLTWGAGGAAVGALLGGAHGHSRRSLGRIPLGLTGLAGALLWTALASSGGEVPALPCLFLGVAAGIVSVPLRSGYQQALPEEARADGLALGNALAVLPAVPLLLGLLAQAEAARGAAGLSGPTAQFAALTTLAAVGAFVGWGVLLTPTLEMLAEWLLVPMYRIEAVGPGVRRIPRRGPVVVFANHAAWGDPFWVASIVPRHVRPMMTSRFFDLPVVRWLMTHVVRAIRVPRELVRREAPELGEAIAALRNGEALVIFPEGGMRRDEAQLLRPFGQGIWRILHAVPQTPVVACWIEGGWGSFASYKDGPPAKNKRVDRRRPIRIGVAEPEVLPAEVLADRQRTRDYLYRRCLECRRFLGLDVPPPDAESTPPPAEEREKEVGG